MQPVKKTSAAQLATEELRAYILSGQSAAGERITEQQVSVQLGLSRATVRAAFHQLAREGLITLSPYSGWYISVFRARDIYELYTLRANLEGLASRLAAEQRPEAELNRIQEAFGHLVDACRIGDRDAAGAADFAFHTAIVQAAHHGRLLSLYRVVEQQVQFVITSSNALLGDIPDLVAQHRPILDAIVAGDVIRAGETAEFHATAEGRKLEEHVARVEENS